MDVLQASLAGLEHKFLILLNKVDQLDGAIDFARAYGTLGWALSKVMVRKDIPIIYSTYNAGDGVRVPGHSQTWAPLAAFQKKRDEIVAEVVRAKLRHWDNVISTTEETLRQTQMVAKVTQLVRERVLRRRMQVLLGGSLCFALPSGISVGWLCWQRLFGEPRVMAGIIASYFMASGFTYWSLVQHCWQYENLQLVGLDACFEEAFCLGLAHSRGDLQGRWRTVRERTLEILQTAGSAGALPHVADWEISRIDECLNKDVKHLRSLAKLITQG